jgi:catechol 2,3-dioxygenase-like lactoylglutathione lyase family enzyme
VAIGHVRLPTNDVAASTDFMVKLGLRPIVTRDEFAVLELRGGTHLVVHPAEAKIEPGTAVPFDLIVDDLEATHKHYTELGMKPTEIEPGRIHSSFVVAVPGGYELTINSTHASDQPI